MEALLSLAFDNLSSFDGPKIRKGLRQVEGLLAQICLSNPNPNPRQPQPSSSSSLSSSSAVAAAAATVTTTTTTTTTTATKTTTTTTAPSSTASSTAGTRHLEDGDDQGAHQDVENVPPPPTKNLAQLSHDPAFREFFKLQEGFEWNVAMRLINTLDRLMAKSSDGLNDLLILSALDLTQGALLLHPPSKHLFSREQNMNLLLDLLEPYNSPAIQSATLLTLVVALIDTPRNARAFEALDGLLTITSLFKSRSTAREVKLKLVEFLYFYLMPESPAPPSPGKRDRSPSKHGGARADATLTTEEKQQLLSRHLSSVEDLVKDLRNLSPFGGMVC